MAGDRRNLSLAQCQIGLPVVKGVLGAHNNVIGSIQVQYIKRGLSSTECRRPQPITTSRYQTRPAFQYLSVPQCMRMRQLNPTPTAGALSFSQGYRNVFTPSV